jgi:hypothetical protein
VTEQPSAWLATGLYWQAGEPVLTATYGPRNRELSVQAGMRVAWRLTGPRRCIGIWLAVDAVRRTCPYKAELPVDGSTAQCSSCASADGGLALARDATTDEREFTLYLAWFGPEVHKVGISAADRGGDRLLEQAALAYTILARGPHPAIRRAERLISTSRLARERVTSRVKMRHWWHLPPARERATQVEVAARRIRYGIDWPSGLRLVDAPQVTDHVDRFGVERLPATFREITGVRGGSVVTGTVTALIGRYLLVGDDHADPPAPLLLDGRRLAGWTIRPATGPSRELDLTPHTDPRGDHAQDALF